VKRSANRDKATGRPPSRDELPKQDPTPPKSAPDLHGFYLPVPDYNTRTPRTMQNKKTWWRWEFALRWRKAIFRGNWRLPQRQRHVKNQSSAIWEAILRMLRMNTQIPNINLVRSAWRRVKKGSIEVRDLKPVIDVKGGGGVKTESKSTTSDTGTTGSH
jgi:hypothetical protein